MISEVYLERAVRKHPLVPKAKKRARTATAKLDRRKYLAGQTKSAPCGGVELAAGNSGQGSAHHHHQADETTDDSGPGCSKRRARICGEGAQDKRILSCFVNDVSQSQCCLHDTELHPAPVFQYKDDG